MCWLDGDEDEPIIGWPLRGVIAEAAGLRPGRAELPDWLDSLTEQVIDQLQHAVGQAADVALGPSHLGVAHGDVAHGRARRRRARQHLGRPSRRGLGGEAVL